MISRIQQCIVGTGMMTYALGIGACVAGYWYKAGRENASTIPQEIRLAELIARGSPNNFHILLTDFSLGKALNPQKRTYAYFPIFRADGSVPSVPVLLKVDNRSQISLDWQYVAGLLQKPPVIDDDMLPSVQAAFPGKDTAKIIVIDTSEEVASWEKTYLHVFGGTLLMLIGLACIWGVILNHQRPAVWIEFDEITA